MWAWGTLGRRACAEGFERVCRARVAVRCEVRAVAGKRGLPRGRAPGFMCNEAADFLGTAATRQGTVYMYTRVCIKKESRSLPFSEAW